MRTNLFFIFLVLDETLIHRRQNWSKINFTCFQRRLVSPSNAYSRSGARWRCGPPSTKWFGVIDLGSFGSVWTWVRGRLFQSDANSANTVRNTSSLIEWVSRMARNAAFLEPISRSQKRFSASRLVVSIGIQFHGPPFLLRREYSLNF